MKTPLCLWAAATAATVFAEPAWRDTQVNSENREKARAYTMPLESEKAAFTDDLEPDTPYRLSLNGEWKFDWCGQPAQRPVGFERPGYDDSEWSTIPVPSCPDLHGWGAPNYVNTRYPFPATPPFTPENENAVCSYRTTFAVPPCWTGRETFLRFDGVGSAATVWINGKKVGYTEDSMLPAEFDVTRLLKPGANLLAVEVRQRSDGSYLEDQDFFRFYGIFRDVTLFSTPETELRDFRFATAFNADYSAADATLEADVRFHGAKGGEAAVSATLYDAEGRIAGAFPVVRAAASAKGGEAKVRTGARFERPRLWSAEDPYLYTLVLRAGADVRAAKVGFRETKIVGNVLTVNGRNVKFHGVNRHECSAVNGRTVSLDEMMKDVLLMKRHNIDTVRTCHYPDHHLWYALCDRYGLYVVAEANVESHGMGYTAEKGLGFNPAWKKPIVERNENNALNWRNHASVFMWSLGNESGAGENFRAAKDAVKALDPTRPVHYEGHNEGMDVDSQMYPAVEMLEQRALFGEGKVATYPGSYTQVPGRLHTASKPFFLCEYAHAMGNAMGNFKEYWDVFDAHDCLAGGCVWDWVDQAVWKYADRLGPDGRRVKYLAYGGDFDDEPNDGPFCCNGIVDAARHVTPKLIETAHVHRPLAIREGANAADGTAVLRNRLSFTRADAYAGAWELVEDGRRVAGGALRVPPVEPGKLGIIDLPQPQGYAPAPNAECFYNVSFALKAKTRWADAGHVVARDQLPWKPVRRAAAPAKAAAGEWTTKACAKFLTVEGEGTRAVFCRRTGTLARLEMGGRTILADADGVTAGPRLTCARAFTDNDCRMRARFYKSGLTQLSYHVRRLACTRTPCGKAQVVSHVRVTGAHSAGFDHVARYTFLAGGAMRVENDVTPFGDQPPELPRLGTTIRLDPALENVVWYGRGPHENYVDRRSSAFVGLWESTATALYEDYVRPQDNGCRTDVRWAAFTDAKGAGVLVKGSTPFIFSAQHYDFEDLEYARHRNGEQRRWAPPVAQRETILRLDAAQTGLGGASCGPEAMEKYRFKPQPTKWTTTFKPVVRGFWDAKPGPAELAALARE